MPPYASNIHLHKISIALLGYFQLTKSRKGEIELPDCGIPLQLSERNTSHNIKFVLIMKVARASYWILILSIQLFPIRTDRMAFNYECIKETPI